jgi:hypothetical protein
MELQKLHVLLEDFLIILVVVSYSPGEEEPNFDPCSTF